MGHSEGSNGDQDQTQEPSSHASKPFKKMALLMSELESRKSTG